MQSDYSHRGPEPSFLDRLGELVRSLRARPSNPDNELRLLHSLMSSALRTPVVIEAGVENSWDEEERLSSRLLARGVDLVRISPAARGDELLALARALADDVLAVPSTPMVQVEMVHLTPPRSGPDSGRARLGEPAQNFFSPVLGEVRSTTRAQAPGSTGAETARLEAAVEDAIARAAWVEVAHMVQALIRLLPAISEMNRRSHAISMRRHLTRPVLEGLIETAFRIPEEEKRIGEVLRWAGIGAGELMLEVIRHSEPVGPRAFLFTALGGMPEAYSIVLPLLSSSHWYEVRHAAEVLGLMGDPRAIDHLSAQLQHPDERVRLAVIEALGRFPGRFVVEPLRQALSHASPATRAHAGHALAARRSGAFAMPLLAALEIEKDQSVWRELLRALTRIDAPEAIQALVRLAVERRSLLRRGGHTGPQRLMVVELLAESGTPHARQALERIEVEGDPAVKEAAARALECG